jgi:hypothetical protein
MDEWRFGAWFFELAWFIIQLLLWCTAIVGAAILLFAVLVGTLRAARTWVKPKELSRQRIQELAMTTAIMEYKDQPNADWRIDTFVAGASWAHERLHKR